MLKLSKSYKEIFDSDIKDGVFYFEGKSNTPIKLTEKDKDFVFRFVEKSTNCDRSSGTEVQVPFEETLDVTVALTSGNIAVLGTQCCSHELDKSGVRATDLLYIFLSSENNPSKCCCHIYDLKRSFGGASKDVVRFYDQCISTAKYGLTICYEVNSTEDGCGFYEPNLNFGVVTENYDEESLQHEINKLKVNPIDANSSFGKKMLAQGRQNPKVVNILEQILNKKIRFNNTLYDLNVRIMGSKTHTMTMKFNDGNVA